MVKVTMRGCFIFRVHGGGKGKGKRNIPVPFPTAGNVASGPRVSKSSFISSAPKHRRRKRGGLAWGRRRRRGEYLNVPAKH